MSVKIRLRLMKVMIVGALLLVIGLTVYPIAVNIVFNSPIESITLDKAVALAANMSPQSSSVTLQAEHHHSVFEEVDLIKAILAMLFAIIGWFFVHTACKIDKSQNLLFDKLSTLRSDFDHLKGEHDVLSSDCQHRRKEDYSC